MALTVADKSKIVKTWQRAKADTGSPEVQIALLTARIEYLTQHMKGSPKDFHSRYGLTCLVSQRRRMMTYLKRINPVHYREVLDKLAIRG